MKKVIFLISALVLSTGLLFAQTPQTQEKNKPATKTEVKTTEKKEVKSDKKEMKNDKKAAPQKAEKQSTTVKEKSAEKK